MRSFLLPATVLTILFFAVSAVAERGVLVVYVADAQGRPISQIEIGTKGDGGSARTKTAVKFSAVVVRGKARIPLPPDTKPNARVSLYIVHSPLGHNFVMISPWDSSVRVPPFENESDNFASLVVAEHGDRALLENGTFLRAAMKRYLNQAAPGKDQSSEQNRDALEEVARIYGLPGIEIDAAIRALGEKTQDPYEKGLAALYEEKYALSTGLLSESARIRETRAEKADAEAADVDLYLGRSLYLEGRFRESVSVLKRADKWRPDDSFVLNVLAMSLSELGDYAAAEPHYRRALEIDERIYGLKDPNVASIKTNLAFLLRDTGNYAGAKQLFQEALNIDEESLGPLHPKVAINMSNLAMLLTEVGDCESSEVLLQKVLNADKVAYSKGLVSLDSPAITAHGSNFAGMLQCKGDYPEAERNYRQVLDLDDKAGRHNHPSRAITLCGLASTLAAQGKYDEAEKRFREALAIDRNALGPDHPRVATDADALGTMFLAQKNYGAAEEQLREALRIDEAGSNYFSLSRDLQNLARLFHAKGDEKTRLEFLMKALKLQKEHQQKLASQEGSAPPKQP